jgi:hypothetical protein
VITGPSEARPASLDEVITDSGEVSADEKEPIPDPPLLHKVCSEGDVHFRSGLRPELHHRLRTTRYQPHSCFHQKPEKQRLWQSLLNTPIDRAVLF